MASSSWSTCPLIEWTTRLSSRPMSGPGRPRPSRPAPATAYLICLMIARPANRFVRTNALPPTPSCGHVEDCWAPSALPVPPSQVCGPCPAVVWNLGSPPPKLLPVRSWRSPASESASTESSTCSPTTGLGGLPPGCWKTSTHCGSSTRQRVRTRLIPMSSTSAAPPSRPNGFLCGDGVDCPGEQPPGCASRPICATSPVPEHDEGVRSS